MGRVTFAVRTCDTVLREKFDYGSRCVAKRYFPGACGQVHLWERTSCPVKCRETILTARNGERNQDTILVAMSCPHRQCKYRSIGETQDAAPVTLCADSEFGLCPTHELVREECFMRCEAVVVNAGNIVLCASIVTAMGAYNHSARDSSGSHLIVQSFGESGDCLSIGAEDHRRSVFWTMVRWQEDGHSTCFEQAAARNVKVSYGGHRSSTLQLTFAL